jgi:hypothetical protein
MPLLLSTLLLSSLAANPSLLDGTWHLVAVEEDGQAVAPGTATLTVRRGRFEAKDDRGELNGAIAGQPFRGYHAYQILRRFLMTTSARKLLAAFDALPPEEQQEVAAEILRRTVAGGALPEAALDEMAGELFRGYDAEESSRADS